MSAPPLRHVLDRWGDDEDTKLLPQQQHPQGRVARMGMAGFVKSSGSMGSEGATAIGAVEIVQSKKEQRRQHDTQLMPPPPPPGLLLAPKPPAPPPPAHTQPGAAAVVTTTTSSAGSAMPAAPAGPATAGHWPGFEPPAWLAAEPRSGAVLEVLKDGVVLGEVPLRKSATLFGRNDVLSDVVLEHASVSRQHAALCFEGMTGRCMVLDLGSAHGTWVDGRPATKASPVELRPGAVLKFAASTRTYVYRVRPAGAGAGVGAPAAGGPAVAASQAAGGGPAPVHKRPSQESQGQEAPAAGVAAAGAPKRTRVTFGEEQVIGYSDGRDGFAARVGPRPGGPAGQGLFANAVSTTVLPAAGGAGSSSGSGSKARLQQERHPSKMPPPPQDGARSGSGSPAERGTGERGPDAAPGGEGADNDGGPAPQAAARAGEGHTDSRGHHGANATAPVPAAATAGGEAAGGGSGGGGGGVGVRQELQSFVQQLRSGALQPRRGGSGGLYDELPPPSVG